jgi:hypothetical protein
LINPSAIRSLLSVLLPSRPPHHGTGATMPGTAEGNSQVAKDCADKIAA